MTPRRDEGLLRDHDIMADSHLVLVVEPDAFADPAAGAYFELPGKLDPRSRAEDDSRTDLCAEHAQHATTQTRADLPGVRHEQQFEHCPEIHDYSGSIPGSAFAGCLLEGNHRHGMLFCHSASWLSGQEWPDDSSISAVPNKQNSLTLVSINYSPEPTGIAPYAASLATEMVSRGFDVNVLTAHPHYPEWRIADGYGQWSRVDREHGVRVRRMLHYVPKSPSSMKRLLSELSFGVRAACASWRGADVVVLVSPALFSSAAALVSRLLPFRKRPKVLLWVQDLYSLGVTETGAGGSTVAKVMTKVEAWVANRADGVVTIHDRFSRYVVQNLHVDQHKVRAIRNWTHLGPRADFSRASIRAKFGWPEQTTIVLHAGNQGAKQGLETVVEAAREADRRAADVRFVLLGDGNQRLKLERLAAGVERMQFIDPVAGDDFQAVLGSADVLLVNELPGVAEMAVPSKLTSYFDAGLPVLIASEPTSIAREEVAAADAGVHVQSGDPGAMLDAAIALSEDAEAAERFGENGRKYRVERLGVERAVDDFVELVQEVSL